MKQSSRGETVNAGRYGTAEATTPDGGHRDERSIGDLVRELTGEASTLVREEIALVRTEMSEKATVFQRNIGSIAIGGALLLAATLLLVEAVNRGLTALLTDWLGLGIAVWLAPLILAAILMAVGFSLVQKGRAAIQEEGVKPRATAATLKADKEWIERKVKS